jgi:hypothetical protein
MRNDQRSAVLFRMLGRKVALNLHIDSGFNWQQKSPLRALHGIKCIACMASIASLPWLSPHVCIEASSPEVDIDGSAQSANSPLALPSFDA